MPLKKVFKAISNPRHALYRFAKNYISKYEGFSYDFNNNGEKQLIEKLKTVDIKTVFDVGANVGGWTNIALKNFPNARIYSFELSEATFETLQKNVNDKNTVLSNIGLSDVNGNITYKDYGKRFGVNSTIMEASFPDTFSTYEIKSAAVQTGDSFCSEHNIDSIDLLKIDVEGAEHKVLSGFSEMLQGKKIKVIQFEYGYAHGDAHFLMKDFYKLLNKSGYILGPMKPSGVLFRDFSHALNNFDSGPNFVAVDSEQSEIINLIQGKAIPGYLV